MQENSNYLNNLIDGFPSLEVENLGLLVDIYRAVILTYRAIRAGSATSPREAEQQAKAVLRDIDESEIFRAALKHSLEKLPALILALSQKTSDDEDLVKLTDSSKGSEALIICPRFIVLRHFEATLIEDLEASAELSRVQDFPREFLSRIAIETENEYFSSVTSGTNRQLDDDSMIAFRSETFRWIEGEVLGHYYIGHCRPRWRTTQDLNSATFDQLLQKQQIKLGQLSQLDIEKIAEGLKTTSTAPIPLDQRWSIRVFLRS